jgi:putative ABC transport system permease protein
VFRALGVKPLLGRIFEDAEMAPDAGRTTVLSEELWRHRYGADPNIVGKAVVAGSGPRTVVGVMPAGFNFPDFCVAWAPIQADPATLRRQNSNFLAIARLRPGVSLRQASAEVDLLLAEIHRQHPEADDHRHARVAPLRQVESQRFERQIVETLAAAGVLLLIACANVGNLLLVRTSARGREMAIRMAVGASRRRVIRQLATESLLLGLTGGLTGALLAYCGTPLLKTLFPVDLPRWVHFVPDYRLWCTVLALTLATTVISGAAPAIAQIGINVAASLKQCGRGASGPGSNAWRGAMVVAEVALSVILLAGAALNARSLRALRGRDIGYRPEHVLSLITEYPATRYTGPRERRRLVQDLLCRIGLVPGVDSVTFASALPFDMPPAGRRYEIEGRPHELKDMPWTKYMVVTSGYFETLGVPLIEGRGFDETDYDGPQVIVVSRTFEQQNYPGESALGKRVRFGPPSANEPWMTIVGVVGDKIERTLYGDNLPGVYQSYRADGVPRVILVRGSGDPSTKASPVTAAIQGYDPNIAVYDVAPMAQRVELSVWSERTLSLMLGAFAVIALILAAAGLYATLSFAVSRNTREIAIRMALGASRSAIRRFWIGYALKLTLAGLVIGAGAGLVITRSLRPQLYAVSIADPLTYAFTAAVLLAVAAFAASQPATRATRIDPRTVLGGDI